MAKEIHRATSLTTLIQQDNLTNAVEIGVAGGRLSRELLTRNPALHLYLVDFWPPEYQLYDDPDGEKVGIERAMTRKVQVLQLMQEFPNRTRLIELPSVAASMCFPDFYFDLVFIDAGHLYKDVMEDIRAWERKVRSGKWLTGHDYSPRFPGVIEAVDEYSLNKSRMLQTMPGDVWAWRV